MELTEKIENNLIEYFNLNGERKRILSELEDDFRPILNKAIDTKDSSTMLDIINTFPDSEFTKEVSVEMSKLFK